MSKPIRENRKDGLSTQIFSSKRDLGVAAAEFVAATLRQVLAERGHAGLVLATGASQYEFLARLQVAPDIDWQRVTAFHLDEYLDLPADHPASFRRYLKTRFFDHVPVGTVHLLNGNAADPLSETQRYADLLQQTPPDIACIGIGENGHLAFNDPPADFEAPETVHVVQLDEACRRQQVGEGHFDSLMAVPQRALSLSIPAIMAVPVLSCVVPDARKARAVQCSVQGPVSPHCPASILQRHQNCRLFLDRQSASLIAPDLTQ